MIKTKELNKVDSTFLGFTSLEKEYSLDNISVQGNIPEWLKGSFIRNSVSKLEIGKDNYNHWFDGLAMFHAFYFDKGQVSYKNKFLQSTDYKNGMARNKITDSSFGTSPKKNIIEKISSLFNKQENIPNANVNITSINGEMVAMTEIPGYVKFSPDNLETKDLVKFDDKIKGQITTAHPHYDFKRNVFYNSLINISKTSNYIFYKLNSNSQTREVVASINVDKPALVHSFSMTDNYLILIECPLFLNPLGLIFSGKPFIENYQWKPEKGTTFYVVEKDSGKVTKVHTDEPFFTFHPVNAFEENNKIIIDIPVYQNSEIINDFYLENLRKDKDIHSSTLKRYTLDLSTGKASSDQITDKFIELPRLNYKDYNGKNYSWFYANSLGNNQKFLNQIIKFNVKTDENLTWSEDGCYPSEPIFIKKPSVISEDEGIVLSTVLNVKKSNSFLLILDAKIFSEMARVEVPHHIPLGFHGQFIA